MHKEFIPPTAQELANGIISSGRTPQQFVEMLDVMQSGVSNGTIRNIISCWENKKMWFEMARSMYVGTEGPVLKRDAATGIHLGGCDAPTCLELQRAYFEVLRVSTPEDCQRIANFLDRFERRLVEGRLRPSLTGKPAGCYDSATGESLRIIKAVDITHWCRPTDEGGHAILVYSLPQRGTRVEIFSTYPGTKPNKLFGSSVAYGLDSSIFNPEDVVFKRFSRSNFQMDPYLLHEMIIANAPAINR